jgi:hypothetical protein
MRTTLSALFLLPIGALLHELPAAAVQPDHYQSDAADLTRSADTVLMGLLEKQEIGISDTLTDIRITRVFKGAFRPGQSIRVRIRSGRVMISQDQPDTTGIRQAIFFLKDPVDPKDPHVFLQDNYGFKPVINDNVYTNPQDPMQTVKLKKYQEALVAVAAPKSPKSK